MRERALARLVIGAVLLAPVAGAASEDLAAIRSRGTLRVLAAAGDDPQ